MPLPLRMSCPTPLRPAKSPSLSEVRPPTLNVADVPVIAARCASVTCEQSLAADTLPTMTSRTSFVRPHTPSVETVCVPSTLPPMLRQGGMLQTAGNPSDIAVIVAPFSRSVFGKVWIPLLSCARSLTSQAKTSLFVPDPRT